MGDCIITTTVGMWWRSTKYWSSKLIFSFGHRGICDCTQFTCSMLCFEANLMEDSSPKNWDLGCKKQSQPLRLTNARGLMSTGVEQWEWISLQGDGGSFRLTLESGGCSPFGEHLMAVVFLWEAVSTMTVSARILERAVVKARFMSWDAGGKGIRS